MDVEFACSMYTGPPVVHYGICLYDECGCEMKCRIQKRRDLKGKRICHGAHAALKYQYRKVMDDE